MEDLKNLFNEWVEVQKWVITILTLLPPPSKIEMKFLFWQLCVLFTNVHEFAQPLCNVFKPLQLTCLSMKPNIFIMFCTHNSYWGRKRSISSWPRVYLHNCRAHRGTTPPVRSLVSIRNYDASFEKFRNLPTFTCLVTWYWLNIHKLLMQNWHTWNRNAN